MRGPPRDGPLCINRNSSMKFVGRISLRAVRLAHQRPSYWVDIVRFRYRPLTLACSASRMARISRIPRTVSGGGCSSNAASAALPHWASNPASIENRASVGQLSDRQRERARIVADRGNALTRRAANNLNQVGWQWRALVAPCPLYPQKQTCAVQSPVSAKGQKRT